MQSVTRLSSASSDSSLCVISDVVDEFDDGVLDWVGVALQDRRMVLVGKPLTLATDRNRIPVGPEEGALTASKVGTRHVQSRTFELPSSQSRLSERTDMRVTPGR